MLFLNLVCAQGSVDFIEQTQALDVDRLLRADAEVPGAEDEVEVLARVELVPLEVAAEGVRRGTDDLDKAEDEAGEDDEEVGDRRLVVPSVVLAVVAIVEDRVLQQAVAHEEVNQNCSYLERKEKESRHKERSSPTIPKKLPASVGGQSKCCALQRKKS